LYYYETERKDIPGRVREEPLPRGEPVHREKIIVQVKGGGVNRSDVATLLGDVENQKAAAGVLIILEKPSKQMRAEGRRRRRLHIQALARQGLSAYPNSHDRGFAQRHRARRCATANKSVCDGCARTCAGETDGDAVEWMRSLEILAALLVIVP